MLAIEKIGEKERQTRLFQDKLSIELNSNHKLYKLRDLINWTELESAIEEIVNVKRYGRAKKSLRVMLGLSIGVEHNTLKSTPALTRLMRLPSLYLQARTIHKATTLKT